MSACVVSVSSMSSGRMDRAEDCLSRLDLRLMVPGSQSIRTLTSI